MYYVVGLMGAMLALAPPAWAKGEYWPPIPDAEEIIAGCEVSSEAIAKKGLGHPILEKEYALGICLESNIKENLKILIDEDIINEGGTIDTLMKNVRISINQLYGHIASNNKACNGPCGTMWNALPYSQLNMFYENILRDVLMKRNAEELGR